jgi:pyruvate kinase
MDLQGPKLRVGRFADGKVQLQRGQALPGPGHDPGDERRVNLHPEIIAALEPGMDLLLDDGKLRLRVTPSTRRHRHHVLNGGELSDRKGVNVPQAVLDLSPLTAKDRRDLSFGLELGVDWVALSFVQRRKTSSKPRQLIGDRAFLMAKIEKPSAVEQLREIAELSDAIMVARGDLGVEVPAERAADPESHHQHLPPAGQTGGGGHADARIDAFLPGPDPRRSHRRGQRRGRRCGRGDAVGRNRLGRIPAGSRADDEQDHPPGGKRRTTRPSSTSADRKPKPPFPMRSAARSAASAILPVAVLVNYRVRASTLRAARERPTVPILNLTPNLQTARRLSVAWGVHSVVNDRLRQVDEVCSTALEIAQAQGMASVATRC